MAVFTAGTIERKMNEIPVQDPPLMAAQPRPRNKKRWYTRTELWAGVGAGLLLVGGIGTLFMSHGGDTDRSAHQFVPWVRSLPVYSSAMLHGVCSRMTFDSISRAQGRDSAEPIIHHYGALARAEERLNRAVHAPDTYPKARKESAAGNLAAKKVSHWDINRRIACACVCTCQDACMLRRMHAMLYTHAVALLGMQRCWPGSEHAQGGRRACYAHSENGDALDREWSRHTPRNLSERGEHWSQRMSASCLKCVARL